METVKAYYDGDTIVLPESFHHRKGPVFVVFPDVNESMVLAEEVFIDIWDNDEDAAYDHL